MAPRLPLEIVHDLATAVITSSDAPLVLLDADLTVVAASKSFCRAFQLEPNSMSGSPFNELGAGEWNVPQLTSLLNATASGHAEVEGYEMELRRNGQEPRCLVLNAHKLEYADGSKVRLLLSITDITDARLATKHKEDLVREKAVLLQELQHRVANSLQIIASVLMQSARKTQSGETRLHLHDAHQRVMSVAALQKHLAESGAENVELRPYFQTLCRSIGASMIADHDQLSIEVKSDESIISSEISVSMGLIITELVINSLKHAFPKDRKGKIVVEYQSHASDWTLSVSDDGIGMSKEGSDAKAGLGTSIVQALARQLQAHIKVADGNPGTSVSITHSEIASADGAKVVPLVKAV